MIILTQAQADQIRGLTQKGHALAPKPFVASGASNPALNGMYGLPESVLTDPYHQKHWAFLSTLPKIADNFIHAGIGGGIGNSPVTGSDWSQDKTLVQASTYQSNWPAGGTVSVDLVGGNVVTNVVGGDVV